MLQARRGNANKLQYACLVGIDALPAADEQGNRQVSEGQ